MDQRPAQSPAPVPARPLWRRLLRQRRRLAVLCLCVALAAALRDAPFSPAIPALAAGIAAAAFLILAPARRRWAEAAGLGIVLAAALPVSLAVAAALAPVAALLAHDLLYGRLSRLTRLRLALVLRQSRVLPGSSGTLWCALVPGESHPEDHWTGTLADFDRDPEDPDTVYLRYRRPEGGTEEMTLTFVTRERFRHCRYFLDRAGDAGLPETVMTLGFSDPLPGLCRIEARLEQAELPLAQALSRWFDDVLGAEFDGLTRAMCHRRAGPTTVMTPAQVAG